MLCDGINAHICKLHFKKYVQMCFIIILLSIAVHRASGFSKGVGPSGAC